MSERPQREVDDRLADWVDDRMSEKERERFVAELRVNAQLRQDLERYERTVGVVRAALRAPAPPAGIADRVMAAIANPAGAPVSQGPRGFTGRRVVWSLAAAAALLAAAIGIDNWRPAPASHDTAATDSERAARELPPPAAAPPKEIEEAEERADKAAAGKWDGQPEAKPQPGNEPPRTADDAGRVRVAREGEPAATTGAPAAAEATREPTDGKARAEQRFGADPGGTPLAPAAQPPGGVLGPTTGGSAQRADAPVPLMVVEGLAVAPVAGDAKAQAAKGEAARDRGSRRGAPPADGGEGGKTKSGEAARQQDSYLAGTMRLDDVALALRVDAFLADAATVVTPPAAIGWNTARGELRLSPMVEAKPEAAPQAGAGTAGANPPIVRTWLVEGTRADLEVLLARLARFTAEHQLTLRAEETKAPAEKDASAKNEAELLRMQREAAPQQGEVSRMVLRFRLRPR